MRGEPRLGISGFPAEGGLICVALGSDGITYRNKGRMAVCVPTMTRTAVLITSHPLGEAATDFLIENAYRAVLLSEIYDVWSAATFRHQAGSAACTRCCVSLLSQKFRLWRFTADGIFQARISDLDIDYPGARPCGIFSFAG